MHATNVTMLLVTTCCAHICKIPLATLSCIKCMPSNIIPKGSAGWLKIAFTKQISLALLASKVDNLSSRLIWAVQAWNALCRTEAFTCSTPPGHEQMSSQRHSHNCLLASCRRVLFCSVQGLARDAAQHDCHRSYISMTHVWVLFKLKAWFLSTTTANWVAACKAPCWLYAI